MIKREFNSMSTDDEQKGKSYTVEEVEYAIATLASFSFAPDIWRIELYDADHGNTDAQRFIATVGRKRIEELTQQRKP